MGESGGTRVSRVTLVWRRGREQEEEDWRGIIWVIKAIRLHVSRGLALCAADLTGRKRGLALCAADLNLSLSCLAGCNQGLKLYSVDLNLSPPGLHERNQRLALCTADLDLSPPDLPGLHQGLALCPADLKLLCRVCRDASIGLVLLARPQARYGKRHRGHDKTLYLSCPRKPARICKNALPLMGLFHPPERKSLKLWTCCP